MGGRVIDGAAGEPSESLNAPALALPGKAFVATGQMPKVKPISAARKANKGMTEGSAGPQRLHAGRYTGLSWIASNLSLIIRRGKTVHLTWYHPSTESSLEDDSFVAI